MRLAGSAAERSNELVDVGVPAPVAELERVALRKPGDGSRERLHRGHGRAADEERQYANATPEGCGNLLTHEVVGRVESPPLRIANRQPVGSDEDERDLASAQRGVDDVDEILPRRQAVD